MGILYQGNKQILGGGAGSLTELGVIASAYELNYVDGVTSNIQTQLNDKASISDLEDIAFVGDEEAIDATIPLNASTLGGKTESMLSVAKAVDSDTLGGKTEDMLSVANASTLGGKAPEYYIQPRNLLDNSDFTNPVNQRGLTTYSGSNSYTIDRWKSINANATITVNSDCINIKSTSGSATYTTQFIEPQKIKTNTGYTFAVKLKNGAIYTVYSVLTVGMPAAISYYTVDGYAFSVRINYDVGVATWGVQFTTSSVNGFDIEWAALYEGEYTVDTLPPYVPKGYTAELLECRRCYRRYSRWNDIGSGYVASNGGVYIMIPCDIPMRVNPTAVGNIFELRCNGNVISITKTPTVTKYNNVIELFFANETVATSYGNHPCYLTVGNSTFELNANF